MAEKDVDFVELATLLHGHFAPGVALGLRMGQIALQRLGLARGDKRLFAVVETTLCLADGVQAITGCTAGHNSLRVEDFGKLALCLARSDTKSGVRVSLKRDLKSPLLNDWLTRKRKLNHRDEEELSKEFLNMSESLFHVEEVTVEPFSRFDESKITACENCSELVPEGKTVVKRGKKLCKPCSGLRYYKQLNKDNGGKRE